MRKQGLVRKAEILLSLINPYQIRENLGQCQQYLRMATEFYRKSHKRFPERIKSLRETLGYC
jgi:hypothetical protein